MTEEAEAKEVTEARDLINKVVERFSFVREPGVILAVMQGKFQAYMKARIEEDIDGRFKDKSATELDVLLAALASEMGALVEKREAAKAAAAEAERQAKIAAREQKKAEIAQKRAAKKNK